MCDNHVCGCSKKGEIIMHDLKYAHTILDSLKKEIGKGSKSKKAVVEAYLSPFSHVTPERLKDVFKLIAEDAGYTNVMLNVSVEEFCIHCKKCGQTWKSAKPTFKCPKCDSADFDLEKWEEFYIDSIRVEEGGVL